jgi:hypothetical protein
MPHAACREQVEGFLDSLCDERVVSEFADWYIACCSYIVCVACGTPVLHPCPHTQCCTLHAACLHGACYTVRGPSAAHAHRTARRIAAEGRGAPIGRILFNRIGCVGASRPHEAVRTMRMAVRSKEKLAAVRTSLGEAAGAAGPLRLSLGHTIRRAALLEHERDVRCCAHLSACTSHGHGDRTNRGGSPRREHSRTASAHARTHELALPW